MLAMKIPMKDNGEWGIDLDKAQEFWKNLDSVMPDEVGSVLTPMDIEKISFERTHTGDIDNTVEAEQALYTAAGVSSLLFNNPKARFAQATYTEMYLHKHPSYCWKIMRAASATTQG